jgi:hypothetical protein
MHQAGRPETGDDQILNNFMLPYVCALQSFVK